MWLFHESCDPCHDILLCLIKIHVLEERQAGFFSGLEIFFDQPSDHGPLLVAEIHGFGIGKTTAHVPAHFQRFVARGLHVFLELVYQFGYLVRVRDQEPEAKKRLMSRVKLCSYLCWHATQVSLSGCSSLAWRSSTM